MKVKDIIPKAPNSVWLKSLGDLTMTPQEKALRAKATHDWLATKRVLSLARRRQALAVLKSQDQQAPTERQKIHPPLIP